MDKQKAEIVTALDRGQNGQGGEPPVVGLMQSRNYDKLRDGHMMDGIEIGTVG